jgi:hypothetical protein
MGISLSGGPWQYNRFDQFDEAAKPDYLDFDKDGDKKEPMKKALKEKGGKKCPKCGKSPCECGKSDMKEWVNEMVEEGIDLGEYTWDDMVEIFNEGMKHREVDTGKVVDKAEVGKTYYPHGERQKSSVALRKEKEAKGMKEEVCYYLMNEGFANNPVSAEIMFNHMSEEWLEAIEERYKGKHGQSDKEYADSRSEGGKMVSGDSKQSGAEYTHGRRVKAENPGMQPDVGGKTKPKSQGKMDKWAKADLAYRKANLKKN